MNTGAVKIDKFCRYFLYHMTRPVYHYKNAQQTMKL